MCRIVSYRMVHAYAKGTWGFSERDEGSGWGGGGDWIGLDWIGLDYPVARENVKGLDVKI